MSVYELNTSSNARLESLRSKHAVLSSRIEDAQKNPLAAGYYLTQLKKQKLLLKEEIDLIRRSAAN